MSAKSRPLKVYGWTGYRIECPPAPNGSLQTREIVAATSWREAERLYGERINPNFRSETWNKAEVALAMSRPGVVFWCPLTRSYYSDTKWTAASPPEVQP